MSANRAIQQLVTQVNMLAPVSTATLGVESGSFDARNYAPGSRFLACFSTGIVTEGTLTYSVVDCDTSGGTYTAVPAAQLYGTLATATSATDEVTVVQAFDVNPLRPFVKLKTVETVSVTTAVPVHQYIVVLGADA